MPIIIDGTLGKEEIYEIKGEGLWVVNRCWEG